MNPYFISVLIITFLLIAWYVFNIMKDTLGKKATSKGKEEEFCVFGQEATQVGLDANGEIQLTPPPFDEAAALLSTTLLYAKRAIKKAEAAQASEPEPAQAPQVMPQEAATTQSAQQPQAVTPSEASAAASKSDDQQNNEREEETDEAVEDQDDDLDYEDEQTKLAHYKEVADDCEEATVYEGEQWSEVFSDMVVSQGLL